MRRAGNCEESLRNAGLQGFINRLRLQGHGHRIGFIGPGIVEFAVNSDDDRNQLRPSIRGDLQQSHRSRPGVRLALLGELGIG